MKFATTNTLRIAYREFGFSTAPPIILLHGFPDDARAYDVVGRVLAEEGVRVIAPYLRGFAPTEFLERSAPRMAQQTALAQDVIDLADALGLSRFAIGGYDWGCRTACIVAAMHPQRILGAVLMGGYTIQNTITPEPPPPPEVLKKSWFQWYFNTELGRQSLEQNRRALCRFLWHDWSPAWHFADAEFGATAASFDSPDFVDCVVHSYRHRTFNAQGEPRFREVERRLALKPEIEVPTVLLYGNQSGFGAHPRMATAFELSKFRRLVHRAVIDDCGHFVPRENPQAVVSGVLRVVGS